MTRKNKLTINDGFNPKFADGAKFVGKFEIPQIDPTDKLPTIKNLVPFSERNKAKNPAEAIVMFYEHDDKFSDLVRNPTKYLEDLSRFAGVISPDNSLYRDIPLTCQIANIYRNRLIGSFLQRSGINVIANVRWGDERTYRDNYLGEAIAFMGAPEHSVVAVGCYGCIRGKENKRHFRAGFQEMINILKPDTVILYGNLPKDLYDIFSHQTNLLQFKDWISAQHGKEQIYG